jgi:hypothetical protein
MMSIKTQAILGLWAGFLSQFAAGAAIGLGHATWPWLALLFLTIPVLVWGCMRWCQHLGYPAILGLLGVFSMLGFLIMLVLPNRSNPQEDLYLDD